LFSFKLSAKTAEVNRICVFQIFFASRQARETVLKKLLTRLSKNFMVWFPHQMMEKNDALKRHRLN